MEDKRNNIVLSIAVGITGAMELVGLWLMNIHDIKTYLIIGVGVLVLEGVYFYNRLDHKDPEKADGIKWIVLVALLVINVVGVEAVTGLEIRLLYAIPWAVFLYASEKQGVCNGTEGTWIIAGMALDPFFMEHIQG